MSLVIVGRGWQRNEDCGLACSGDFSHRARSGAANEQVGASKGARHVIDEARYLSGNSGAGSSCQRRFVVLFAGLVDKVNSRYLLRQQG